MTRLAVGTADLTEALQQQQQQAEDAVSSIVIRNAERRHWAQPWKRNQEQMQQPVCTLHLPDALRGWKGPRLKLALPSFRYQCGQSHVTEHFPALTVTRYH